MRSIGLGVVLVLVGVAGGFHLRAQAPAALEAIRAEVTGLSRSELPMPAVLATATKP